MFYLFDLAHNARNYGTARSGSLFDNYYDDDDYDFDDEKHAARYFEDGEQQTAPQHRSAILVEDLNPNTTSSSPRQEGENDFDEGDPLRQPQQQRQYHSPPPERLINIDDAINSVGVMSHGGRTVHNNNHSHQAWMISGNHNLHQWRLFLGAGLLLTVDSMELALLSFLSKTAKQHHQQSLLLVLQEEEEDTRNSIAVLPQLPEYYHYDWIVTAGIVGAILGALVWGMLADVIGRRRIVIVSSVWLVICGVATTLFCSSDASYYNGMYEGLIVARFGAGLGVGGHTVAYDLLAEWLPNRTRRGHALLCVQLFWTLGSLLIFILLEQNTHNHWQLVSALCTLPALLATLVFWVPLGSDTKSTSNTLDTMDATALLESPRWLLSRGRVEEALDVLRHAAHINGDENEGYHLFPENTVLYSNESQSRQSRLSSTAGNNNMNNAVVMGMDNFQSNNNQNHDRNRNIHHHRIYGDTSSLMTTNFQWDEVCSLCSFRWMKLSSALLTTYFGQAFCYHGTVAMAVSVFSQDDRQQNYQALFSAGAEVIGIIGLATFTIDRWGRIPTQCLTYAAAALTSLTLSVWYELPFLENGNALIIFAFMSRMFMFGGRGTTWVSTTEVLSTEIRTTGHALAATVGRLGDLSSTWILTKISNLPTIGLVVFFMSVWITFAATDIPETHVKEMGLSYQFLESSTRPRQRRRHRQRQHQRYQATSNTATITAA